MAKKSKTYANDPQATIKQRRKNRERAREKADKLISQVAQTGGYAITALGALGLGGVGKDCLIMPDGRFFFLSP